MTLLIDTNIILDYILQRQPFFENAKSVMKLCSTEKIDGCVALPTVTNMWYILIKIPDEKRRLILKSVCELLQVGGTAHEEVVSAIDTEKFKDFEYCIQTKCAKSAKADYIVTRNISDFVFSEIPAITPEQLLDKIVV